MTQQLIIYLTILFTTCGQKNATIDNGKFDNQQLISAGTSQMFSISKAKQ